LTPALLVEAAAVFAVSAALGCGFLPLLNLFLQ
jgi:hypothetical protein